MVLPQIHSVPNILNSWRFTEATYLIIHHTKCEDNRIIPISPQPSTTSSSLHLRLWHFSVTFFHWDSNKKHHHENQQKSEACQPLGYCHQPGVRMAGLYELAPSLHRSTQSEHSFFKIKLKALNTHFTLHSGVESIKRKNPHTFCCIYNVKKHTTKRVQSSKSWSTLHSINHLLPKA